MLKTEDPFRKGKNLNQYCTSSKWHCTFFRHPQIHKKITQRLKWSFGAILFAKMSLWRRGSWDFLHFRSCSFLHLWEDFSPSGRPRLTPKIDKWARRKKTGILAEKIKPLHFLPLPPLFFSALLRYPTQIFKRRKMVHFLTDQRDNQLCEFFCKLLLKAFSCFANQLL